VTSQGDSEPVPDSLQEVSRRGKAASEPGEPSCKPRSSVTFQCSKCESRFSTAADLKQHLPIHETVVGLGATEQSPPVTSALGQEDAPVELRNMKVGETPSDFRLTLRGDVALLILCGAATISAVVPNRGPFAALIVLAGLCLVPGGALLTLLSQPRDLLTRVAMWFAFSIVIELAGAYAMAALRWWHPHVFAGLIGFAAALLLLRQVCLSVVIRRRGSVLS
jgi:hypothetical protein